MKAFRFAVFLLVVCVAVLLALPIEPLAQNRRNLYLITGFPIRSGPQKVESTLLKIDETRNRTSHVSDLVDESDGLFSVHVDHDLRVAAVVRGGYPPKDMAVIRMDAPESPRVFPIDFGTGVTVFPNLIKTASGNAVLLFRSTAGSGPLGLVGVNLSAANPAAAQTDGSFEDFKYVRATGSWFPWDSPFGGFLGLTFKNGGFLTTLSRSISERVPVEVEFGIPIPTNITPPANSQASLVVNNDDMVVIDSVSTRGTAPGGVVHLLIYDKRAGSWQTADFQKGGSSVRGFGPWIAIKEAEYLVDSSVRSPTVPPSKESPGKEFRQRVVNPQDRESDQTTLDVMFQGNLYVSGTMHLYNIKSKRRYTISTGQGDSEILLVDGSTVYYRVNYALYRNTVGANGLGTPVELVAGDVQLAHWAFLGP